ETFVFDDVVARFQACITFDFDCLVYISERRWFENADKPPGRLKFNYLAVELCKGITTRFETNRDLTLREIALETRADYRREFSNLCTVWFKSPLSQNDLTLILNLTKRVFVAFYKNCGSRDHFLESVSRRFVRE